MSSEPEGCGGQEEQQHGMYHVPQHCRRERLIRFPPDHDPQLLHDSSPSTLVFPDLATGLNPSTSACSSYFLQNPSYGPSTQFLGLHSLPLLPATTHDFSLSLSSSSFALGGHQYGGGGVMVGPFTFTGYVTVLCESRYLDPARQLLEETCGGGAVVLLHTDPPDASAAKLDGLSGGDIMDSGVSGTEQLWKKTRLISMLDEVSRRYRQYHQQIQAAITAFESVAGLSMAAPYVTMAFRAMEQQFRRLTNAISDKLHKISKALSEEGLCKEDVPGSGFTSYGVNNKRASNNSGDFKQQQVWRSQRGLPERAVGVLRTWLFNHFLHPYPTDVDKQMLAKQTGLSRNQVSNWFINARVRLWKPMVEEIHSLEARQLRESNGEVNQSIRKHGQPSSASTINPSSKDLWVDRHPTTSKPFRVEISKGLRDDDMLHGHHVEDGTAMLATGDVSLSLGLHQNTGFSLTDLNGACHLGLEECNDAIMGMLGGVDRRRGISGHFLHDYVG